MIDYRLINGYDNYVISTDGKVFSKTRKKYKLLWIRRSRKKLKDGTIRVQKYRTVNLCKNGVQKHFPIHRLLALHFIENPLNKPCVDHKDGDTFNNNLNNLRWATNSENSRNRKAKGFCISKINDNRKSPHTVYWKLENGLSRSKGFLTKEDAETWAATQVFPMAKNYNVEF